MINFLIVAIHLISTVTVILLVLLHAGRGGGLSDMFGGGMGGSLAGATVVERNLDRITVITALIFTVSTLLLALANN
ncbi:MAG: preprotein translocase subunit SecG [Acidimicrobiia bacterium]